MPSRFNLYIAFGNLGAARDYRLIMPGETIDLVEKKLNFLYSTAKLWYLAMADRTAAAIYLFHACVAILAAIATGCTAANREKR